METGIGIGEEVFEELAEYRKFLKEMNGSPSLASENPMRSFLALAEARAKAKAEARAKAKAKDRFESLKAREEILAERRFLREFLKGMSD